MEVPEAPDSPRIAAARLSAEGIADKSNAVHALKRRLGSTSEGAKQQVGEALIEKAELQEKAVQLRRGAQPAVAADREQIAQRVMDLLSPRLDNMQSALTALIDAVDHNSRARAHNARTVDSTYVLQPLKKKNSGGEYAVGALPPEGLFPSTIHDVFKLTATKLDQLEKFYGEAFAGRTVSDRVASFQAYIKG